MTASEDPEMYKLWNKSWDIIGAFFKDMKSSVMYDPAQNENKMVEQLQIHEEYVPSEAPPKKETTE